MKLNTLNEWLNWLETTHPKSWDLGLERINTVAQRLKLCDFECPVITVAGTNGKGSTIAILNAVYQKHAYNVGCYTSPHIEEFNERIQINGQPVTDSDLCEAFQSIYNHLEDISLSYFEFTTLAALLIFKKTPLDVILLEVGLGGRLDAVNIVDSDIAVITTIDIDHIDWLGPDREAIGFEKSGIFRKGKPAIIGDPEPPESVIKQAIAQQCQIQRQGFDFQFQTTQEFHWQSNQHKLSSNLPHLPEQNVSTALMVIESLENKLKVDWHQLPNIISQTQLVGRFQTLNTKPLCIADVAHNPQATLRLAKQLAKHPKPGKTIAVCSFLADKDHQGAIAPLANSFDEWYIYPLDCPRAVEIDTLSQALKKQIDHKPIHINQNIEGILTNCLSECGQHDRIIMFGSFFTVQDALKFFANR